jgi:hypothetical protein
VYCGEHQNPRRGQKEQTSECFIMRRLMVCTPTRYYDEKIEEEKGWVCKSHVVEEKCIQDLVAK